MQYDDKILYIGQGAGFASVEAGCGIFKAFIDFGVVPGRAQASSGSALFTSLFYSMGIERIEKIVSTHQPSDFVNLCPLAAASTVAGQCNYVLDNSKIIELLDTELTGEATKRVKVSVTRLDDWTCHLKRALPSWVLAATSIPFVFKPVKIAGSLWGDGGVFNNIPTIPLDELDRWKHVFVFVAPSYVPFDDNLGIRGLLNLLNAALDREFSQLKESGYFDHPNVTLIHPESSWGGSLFSWSENFGLMKECYDLTINALNSMELK